MNGRKRGANHTDSPVTVTLKTSGTYFDIKRMI